MRGFSWNPSVSTRRNVAVAVCIFATAAIVYAIQSNYVTEGVVCARVHPSGLSDYGQVDLGESRSKIPRDAILSTEIQDEYTAIYTDRTGITYYIAYGEVVRKEITIPKTGHIALPFGFKANDSVAEVLRKIRARRDAPDLYVDTKGTNGFGTEIRTDYCISNRVGAVFDLDIAFDNSGRMLFISTDIDEYTC
jgi:hypothetical protein